MATSRKRITGPPATLSVPSDGWVSVNSTARLLGIAPQSVYMLGLKGDLTTQVVAGRVFVHHDSIETYRAKQRQGVAAVG